MELAVWSSSRLAGKRSGVVRAADSKLDEFDVGPRSDVGWTRVLELSERLPVHQAVALLFGWHTNVEIDRLTMLLSSWLPRISTQLDYNAAVEFMAIALHNQSEVIPELDPLIAGLLQALVNYPETGQQRSDWLELAKRQVSYEPELLLKTLLDLVDRGGLMLHGGGQEAAVLQEIAQKMGRQVLAAALDMVAAGSWRLEMDIRGWFIAEFEPAAVIEWIGEDLGRAQVVASVIGLPKDGPPNELLRYLLNKFGSDEKVASSLVGEYVSGTWWGLESSRLTGQIAHLSSWFDAPESEGVKRWARKVIASLEQQRRIALRDEAEEER
jgi:hypothetical protein